MSNTDHTMSITPPQRMSVAARIGLALTGVGLLMMLVAWTGAKGMYGAALLAGGAGLVTGGVLMSRGKRHQMLGQILLGAGAVIALLPLLGVKLPMAAALAITLICLVGGGVLFIFEAFGKGPAGIRHNGTYQSEVTRPGGAVAWVLAIAMTGFYILLYWFPDLLTGLTKMVQPLNEALTGNSDGNQWFLYGLIYTLAVLVMGLRYILKYRHSRYQVIRTLSVMFFQLVFAFTLPNLLEKLNRQQTEEGQAVITEYQERYEAYKASAKQLYTLKKDLKKAEKESAPDSLRLKAPLLKKAVEMEEQALESHTKAVLAFEPAFAEAKPSVKSHYFTYFWPLAKDGLWPEQFKSALGERDDRGVLNAYQAGFGTFGLIIILAGVGMSLIGVVLLTYFFGKRWYCSWVCGCGGLAETAGDPFRHLSDKSLKAWQIERYLIYSVLALITLLTALLVVNHFTGLLGNFAYPMKSGYGFLISQVFAGVVGTGFYAVMGSRVWCRFGCPQAAVLGILQKYFSRFRITTNGGQCISCGNCSTYCEMGIDVKWYAQRGQNVVRASCVGCGVCSAVCPRGVLNLENGPADSRDNGLNPLSFDKV